MHSFIGRYLGRYFTGKGIVLMAHRMLVCLLLRHDEFPVWTVYGVSQHSLKVVL